MEPEDGSASVKKKKAEEWTCLTNSDESIHHMLNEFHRVQFSLDDVLTVRKNLFVEFNPMRHVIDILDFDANSYNENVKKDLNKLLTGVERSKLLKEIELFFTKLVDSKKNNKISSLLYNDASFVYAMFSYIFNVGYDGVVIKNVPFIKFLNDYVKDFGLGNDYDGFFASNMDCLKNSMSERHGDQFDWAAGNQACITENELSARKRHRIKATYPYPNEKYAQEYCIFLTPYRFLREWDDSRKTVEQPVNLLPSHFISESFDDAFMRKLELITNAFVQKNWNVDLLRKLSDTGSTTMTLSSSSSVTSSPIMRILRDDGLAIVRDPRKTIKYVTGTACCGKTSLLNKLRIKLGWFVPTRSCMGGFSGKCNSPAYVASMHASIDYTLSRFSGCAIGDRGPLDNYLWTFIMPILEDTLKIGDNDPVKLSAHILRSFVHFLNATQNKLSLAYYANHDVLIVVDPYSSVVRERMLCRGTDNDVHRAHIPYYSLVQNITYAIVAHVFEYNMMVVPYDPDKNFPRLANFNTFNDEQDQFMRSHYGSADGEAAVAERVVRSCDKFTKTDVPNLLKSTAFQHAIGIHK